MNGSAKSWRDMFSSGQRLQHFIQDFLTYSVLETGELRMQFTDGDMNACLSEVCRSGQTAFQERGLALYFLANDKLTAFCIRCAKIQRVISNLLENACEVHAPGWHRLAARRTAHVGTPRA